MLHQQRPDHLCRRRWAKGVLGTPLHCAQKVVLPKEVLQLARRHLLQDALLHQVRHAVFAIGDHPNRCAPLLGRLGLLELLLLVLPLAAFLLLRLIKQHLQVGQLLSHLVIHKRSKLCLHDGVHRLPGQLQVVALVEVVALVFVLPLLRVLLDLLHELLHHRGVADPRLQRLLFRFRVLPFLAALGALPFGFVILALGILALLAILPLLHLVVILSLVKALVECVELLRELLLVLRILAVVQDPLPSLFQQLGLDVCALLLLKPLKLLLQCLLEDVVCVLLHLLPCLPVLLHLDDDVGVSLVFLWGCHAKELKLFLPHLEKAPPVYFSLPVRRDASCRQDLAFQGILGSLLLLLLGRLLPRRFEELHTVISFDDVHPSAFILLDDCDCLVCCQPHLKGVLLVQEVVWIQGHAEDSQPVVDLVLLVFDLLPALLAVEKVARHLPFHSLRVQLEVGQNLV
mmetsp:Transcript_36143/g.86597  ORF Transcript_36143/g.86597 Transcript_36143/m.86597 type:complete len:458 (-) Transcript_36143:379-1752(-)